MKNQYIYTFFACLSISFSPLVADGQTLSTGKNAAIHSKFRVASINENDANDPTKALITVSYSDGLGRATQTVGYQQSPTGKDIISGAIEFDKYGRIIRTSLTAPASVGTGTYQSGAFGLANSFYADNYAYAATATFDNSPLNRAREQYGPGTAWRINTKRIQSFDESAGADVRFYYLDGSGNIVLSGTYPVNSLFKNRIIDEQGHTSIQITDKRGRLIQKQQQDESGYITTCYLYDGMGRILAVIQPQGYELNTGITRNSTEWNNWVFAYEYDYRGRQHKKKAPAAGEEYMIYDRWDRLVWSQTALQRESDKWTFYKYDVFNREIMRGEKTDARSFVTIEAEAHAWNYDRYESRVSGGPIYYSYSNAYPQIFSADDIRQVTYYDNYTDWRPSDMLFDGVNAYHGLYPETQGTVTGSRSRNSENSNWLVSVSYYDNKQRVIQSFSHNLYGNTERTDYKYNFAGEAIEIRYLMRDAANNATILLERFDYDNAGRKIAYKLGMNAVGETIATYEYDEIGRLKTKRFYPDRQYQQASTPDYINRPPDPSSNTEDIAAKAVFLNPGTSIDALTLNTYVASIGQGNGNVIVQGLQTINLAYHIRGMLNCVNCTNNQPALDASQNDFFANKLEFETSGWYDGNIGKQSWINKKDNTLRSYTYNYDPAKRLLSSNFASVNSAENYTLSIGGYDKNGNIQSLNRNGLIENSYNPIDQLSYSYSGNRLRKVEDAITGDHNGDFVNNNSDSDDYSYWTDGSLKTDLNKQISLISYDSYLNKVKQVDFSSGKWLKFYYDGDGTLLKRLNSDNEKWEYTPKTIFRDGQLYQISHEEGRVIKVNETFVPEFEYRDIWGNLRATFRDSVASPANDIYLAPITAQFADYDVLGFELTTGTKGSNNFKYQNQERINDFGIGLDLFKFRPSDYQIGRFWQIDPLAEKYVYNSPYALQENKFGKGVELEGKELAPFAPIFSSNAALVRPMVLPRTIPNTIPIQPGSPVLLPATQEHHIIPNQRKGHPVVKEAQEEGFKQDGKENKIDVEKFDKNTGEGRHGNHPEYNNEVLRKLTEFEKETPNRTPKESLDFVRKTVKELKETINNKPDTKINDLFKSNTVVPTDNTRVQIPIDKRNVYPCQSGGPNCS